MRAPPDLTPHRLGGMVNGNPFPRRQVDDFRAVSARSRGVANLPAKSSRQKLPDRRSRQGEAGQIGDEAGQYQQKCGEGANQSVQHIARPVRRAKKGSAQMGRGAVARLPQQHETSQRSGHAEEERAADADRLHDSDQRRDLKGQPAANSKHETRRAAHPRFLIRVLTCCGVLAGAIRQCYPSTQQYGWTGRRTQ